MPNLSDYGGNTSTKLLITGESGAGKTSTIASMVKAGYEVFVVDCDNGLGILREYLSPEELLKVHYLPFRDKGDGKPKAWNGLGLADLVKILFNVSW